VLQLIKCNQQSLQRADGYITILKGGIIKLDLFLCVHCSYLGTNSHFTVYWYMLFKQSKYVNCIIYSRENDCDNASEVLLNRNNLKCQQLTTIIIHLMNIFTCVTNQINFSKVNHQLC